MPVLEIDGIGKVEVGDEFASMPPDRQAAEVDSIAAQLGAKPQPAPAASGPDYANMSAMDVAKSAIQNTPASAVQFGKDIAQPVLHPIDTAIAIKNIGAGVLQKVGLLSGDDQEKYADAVGRFFVDRYGSSEGIKKAIATDPVGVLADIATVLTAGGGALAKAPGMAGKAGEIVKAVGTAVDPIAMAADAAPIVGRATSKVAGTLTQTGGAPLVEAARAGAAGGERARALTESMRGIAPIEDVVSEAKGALQTMRAERGAAYRTAMAKIGKDNTVLDFKKIDDAVKNVSDIKTYKGQDLSPSTKAVRSEITQAIDDWKALDPKEFHTAEGLDALKQKIGDIKDAQAYGTPERAVADRTYSAIRQTIVDQSPDYAKVMKGYEEASSLIKDIEKTLSLNPKANVDTAVRKLQSALRNNVNTDFGRREVLAKYLVDAGANTLITKLAGQTLNTALPRGLGKSVASIIGVGGMASMFSDIGTLPGLVAIGALPLGSPRLMGEAAYGLGKASKFAPNTARTLYQTGRETRVSK